MSDINLVVNTKDSAKNHEICEEKRFCRGFCRCIVVSVKLPHLSSYYWESLSDNFTVFSIRGQIFHSWLLAVAVCLIYSEIYTSIVFLTICSLLKLFSTCSLKFFAKVSLSFLFSIKKFKAFVRLIMSFG